jgi:HD-GYP domain-containing protein (c-di-GMP phosphodiesterase class II)
MPIKKKKAAKAKAAAKPAKKPRPKPALAAGEGELERLRAELARRDAKVLHLENLMMMQLAKLQVMQEVQRVSSGNVALPEMLELFMDVTLRTTGTDAGSIMLLDADARELSFEVVRGPRSEGLKNIRVKVGEGIAGWVAKAGQSVLSEDVSKDHRFTGSVAKQIKVIPHSILCVPLKGKARILGVLEVITRNLKKPFSYDDLSAMESLAGQIGMVLENAELFSSHDEEIRRLEALTSASGVVNSTLDLKVLLKLLMELAAKTLHAEASSILMVDEHSGDLVFEVAVGEKSDQVKEIRVPKGAGIAGAVAESGKPLLIPDASKDERFFRKADEKTSFVTRNVIAVPLVARGKCIGVMEVLNRLGGGTFSHDDMELLQALGHQSAIALQNAQLFENLQESFLSTVRSLAQAVDAKDSYTAGHSSRVTQYSVLIAEELKCSDDEIRNLRMSGLLHDVGKIGIRDSVLSKPGQLDDEEFAVMKSHPSVGAGILKPVRQLKEVIPGVLNHHERFDGRGYPGGLKGEEIPLAGRIIGVADAFDAMTSDRVYRPRLSDEVALAELKKHSGTQFDSRIVKAFLSAYDKGRIKTEPSKFSAAKKD